MNRSIGPAVGLLAALVAASAWLVSVGCARLEVGPFVEGDAFCDGRDGGPVGDTACPDGTHCAFPAPGWRARCMAGDDGLTTPPDWARRRVDGGIR